MSDTDPKTGARLIECGKAKLKCLAPSDMITLANHIRAGYTEDARVVIDEAKLPPERAAIVLLEAKRREIQRGDVISYMLTVEGNMEAIRLAVKRTEGKDATPEDIDALEIPMEKMTDIIADLGGFVLKKKTEAGPANPTPGGLQSGLQTATGSLNQT
jgi:hypothetical protein